MLLKEIRKRRKKKIQDLPTISGIFTKKEELFEKDNWLILNGIPSPTKVIEERFGSFYFAFSIQIQKNKGIKRNNPKENVLVYIGRFEGRKKDEREFTFEGYHLNQNS